MFHFDWNYCLISLYTREGLLYSLLLLHWKGMVLCLSWCDLGMMDVLRKTLLSLGGSHQHQENKVHFMQVLMGKGYLIQIWEKATWFRFGKKENFITFRDNIQWLAFSPNLNQWIGKKWGLGGKKSHKLRVEIKKRETIFFFFFCYYMCLFCMYVYVLLLCPMPKDFRGECRIPWNSSYWQLWVIMWMLGMEPEPPEKWPVLLTDKLS